MPTIENPDPSPSPTPIPVQPVTNDIARKLRVWATAIGGMSNSPASEEAMSFQNGIELINGLAVIFESCTEIEE